MRLKKSIKNRIQKNNLNKSELSWQTRDLGKWNQNNLKKS